MGGVGFDPITEERLVAHVRSAITRGEGGQILTPNIDIVRQLIRNPEAGGVLAASTIVVADGMPLVWASRLAGTPLPQRVCGSDLIWSLSRGLGEDERSVFIVGGTPASAPTQGSGRHSRPRNESTGGYGDRQVHSGDGASRAAARLVETCPGLRICGAVSPPFGFDREPDAIDALGDEIAAAGPDLVLVGIGFPRQEQLIAMFRARLPRTWFLGCGMAIGFVAGEQRRAPAWMQRTGVEWMHRLAAEPRRLADRYLRHDLPFAVSLLGNAAITRWRPRPEIRPAPAPVVPAVRNELRDEAFGRPRPSTGRRNERHGMALRPAVPAPGEDSGVAEADGGAPARHRAARRRHGR